MEVQEETSEPVNNKSEPNVNNEKAGSDKDESGFDGDISACSIDDKTSVHCSVASPLSASTPVDKSFPGRNKKNDSGVFSEVSSNSDLKEISEVDISEITNESNDSTDVESKKNNMSVGNNKCMDKIVKSDSDDANEQTNDIEMDAKDSPSVDANKTKDETNCGEPLQGNLKCDIDNDGDTDHTDDTEQDFSEFVKNKLKSRSHVRKLVNYDSDSDEEKNSSSEMLTGNTGKSKRSYRKRKPESDLSDNDTELKPGDVETGDVDNNGNTSGEPVLLRHSQLEDGALNNVVRLSDLSSDSIDDLDDDDDDDRLVNHKSSDSDPEDAPMEVGPFGAPKHKWRALYDLRTRELGMRPTKGQGLFNQRVQGSLQMVQRFELQYKMENHEGCVNALNFNRPGTLLASGSDDLNVVIWDWIRNRPSLIYDSGHRSNVFQTKFMPFSGDCHVVSCARDGQVRLADLSTTGVCKGTKKLAQHRGAAHKLALTNDSPHIVLSAGEDAVTFEIDLRQGKPNKLVTTKENDRKVSMYSIHSNPANPHEFCLGGRDHFVRVYDRRKINEEDESDGLLKKYAPHHIAASDNNNMKANVTCACFNYNGTEVLGTYNDEDIYLFSNEHSDAADYIHRYRGHRNNQTVKGVNFYGPHSEFIVSGSDCGHIFLWDKATETIVQFMEGDEGGVVNVLEPHPSAPVLATSGLDHDVKIWAPTAENPTTLKGLKKLVKQNARDRDEERTSDAGMIDGSMLWFIMHHLRQGRRRRQREARAARGEPVDRDSDDSSDTLSDGEFSSNGEDSDDEGGPRDAMSCNPS